MSLVEMIASSQSLPLHADLVAMAGAEIVREEAVAVE